MAHFRLFARGDVPHRTQYQKPLSVVSGLSMISTRSSVPPRLSSLTRPYLIRNSYGGIGSRSYGLTQRLADGSEKGLVLDGFLKERQRSRSASFFLVAGWIASAHHD